MFRSLAGFFIDFIKLAYFDELYYVNETACHRAKRLFTSENLLCKLSYCIALLAFKCAISFLIKLFIS